MYSIKTRVKGNKLSVYETIENVNKKTVFNLTDYAKISLDIITLFEGEPEECVAIKINCWNEDSTIERQFRFYTEYGETLLKLTIDIQGYKDSFKSIKNGCFSYSFWN